MKNSNQEENIRKNWYVMRVIARKEGKVKEYIDMMINTNAEFARFVSQIYVPMEKVKSLRDGKEVTMMKCSCSGYVYVEAALVGATQSILRNVPNVLGFLGGSKSDPKPTPLTPQEVGRLFGMTEEQEDLQNVTIPFEIGEKVKVVDGPFRDFNVRVEEICGQRRKLKVSVSIFGRRTPLELDYTQVMKL